MPRMPGTDLDQRLRRLGAAAAAASAPRDPAATERAGRRRRRARRLGLALALAGLVATLVVRDVSLPQPEQDLPARPTPTPPTRQVAHGGLVFSVPASWRVSLAPICPGQFAPEAAVDVQHDPPRPLGWEWGFAMRCPAYRYPVVLLRSLAGADLPGSTQRTVNGLQVRVRRVAPPFEPAQRGTVPRGWSVWQAVFPAEDGGLLLQVADRAGADLFEDILASVRPGRDGGTPGTRRVAFGGISLEVPSSWQVVTKGENPCVRSGAVLLGVHLDEEGCPDIPPRYLEVARMRSPTTSTSTYRLNGFDVHTGSAGRGVRHRRWITVDTAVLVDPPVRLRAVTVNATSGDPPWIEQVLLSLRPAR
jgi:hypothetical protein